MRYLSKYEIWTFKCDNRYALDIETVGEGPKCNWKVKVTKSGQTVFFPEDILKYPKADEFQPFLVPFYEILSRANWEWAMEDKICYEYLTDALNLGIENFGFVGKD